MSNFDFALASVIGSEHVRIGVNNQDSLLATKGDGYHLGVVSDGCGSCGHSEVGSSLIVRLISKCIPRVLFNIPAAEVEAKMEIARKIIVRSLYDMTIGLADDLASASGLDARGSYDGVLTLESVTASCLFATVVGFYACDDYVAVFSIGDGYYAVNGNLVCIETEDAENNAPSYLAYAMLKRVADSVRPGSFNFKVKIFPTSEVSTVMVGTDGLRFMVGHDDTNVPGKSRKVGNISQLWDDKMFLNHDMMRRTLVMLNRDVQIPDWQGQSMLVCPSVLKDDVAVISARRRQ